MEGLTKNENYWEGVVSDVDEVLWHHNYSLPKDILVRDARGRKRLQENKLEELKAALQSNKPLQIEEKYYASLPTETAHTGHPTGQHSGFGQRIHSLLVEQITDLVSSGITNTGEVKKILHHYVKNNLVKQIGIELTISNRALFPTDIDIRNHIATAKRVLELSKLDQENLRLKIMKWQESYKNSKYFFDLTLNQLQKMKYAISNLTQKLNQEASKETQLTEKVIFLEVMSTINKHYYWCIKKIGSNSCFRNMEMLLP